MSPRTIVTRLATSAPAIIRIRQGSSPRSTATGRSPATRRSRTTHEPMQPNAPVTRVAMSRKISHAEGGRVAPRLGPPTEWTGRTEPATMAAVFHSERFFREAWPQISQAFESPTDAASDVEWIVSVAALDAGARVLDAPCGFGRHSIELARRGYQVTGVDFSETELDRARKAAAEAGVSLRLVCQDIRDMEFPAEFDLAVNLFRDRKSTRLNSSHGYISYAVFCLKK